MVKERVLGEGMGNLKLKIVNSKSWLVGRVLVNHGFHGWARMDSEVRDDRSYGTNGTNGVCREVMRGG
jgi:hypothetical protein